MLSVGQKFPEFAVKAVVSTDPKTAFKDITSQTDAGKWKIVFFWPKDFTFVCPTEIAPSPSSPVSSPTVMPSSMALPPTPSSSISHGARPTQT